MDYLEIEGKAQLKRFGIPVNDSILLKGEEIPSEIDYPCILKGQILAGKRGKAGAVKKVDSEEELRTAKKEIEKISINGLPMEAVIACGILPIAEEYYLGMTLDAKDRKMLMLFTPYGGMDIEELAANSPEKLLKVDCTNGLNKEEFMIGIKKFEIPEERLTQLCDIVEKLSKACFSLDATTIEINPLAVMENDELLAIDTKLVIDDNALYRQGDYVLIPRSKETKSIEETQAEQYDLTYLELDNTGDIGTMAGGAGIGMATMDTINYYGGHPNNFLDLGGGVTEEKTYQAMKILLKNKQTDSIFVNIFGGINNCADMARGIVNAYDELKIKKNVVVKSRGFNQEEGWQLYEEHGFSQIKFGTTDEAVQLLLTLKEEQMHEYSN